MDSKGAGNNPLDLGLLGALIRHARVDAGFKTAEEFAAAISEAEGYPVSKETIYKVENGKQEPKLTLYLAIARAVHPYDVPSYDKILDIALCTDWKYPIVESTSDEIFEKYFSKSADDPDDKASY